VSTPSTVHTFDFAEIKISKTFFFQGNLKIHQHLNCTKTTASNLAIVHCIRREFFLQCPTIVSSEKCTAFVTFAKECALFPLPLKGRSYEKKVEKNSEKKAEKNN
jgi:hypothetical protein